LQKYNENKLIILKMKFIRSLLLLFFISHYALCQNPEIDSTGKYHYTICIKRKSTIESKILINKKMDSLTMNDSRIFGKVNLIDKENEPLYPFVEISSLSHSYKESFMTDNLGNYDISLKPDTYNLTFLAAGHDQIKLNEIIFAPGEVRRISVVFGDLDGFCTFDYVTKKPLSKSKLKRVWKKLARKLERRKSKEFAKPQL